MYKKGTKIIASVLVFMMTLSNFSVIGQAVYASSLEAQTKQANNTNVEFDAYFVVDKNQTHSQTAKIGEENALYASVIVKDAGYLKNATITAKDANFEMLDNIEAKEVSKVQKNSITLNKIENGNNIEIKVPIQMLQTNSIAPEQFSKENTIKLTGTYVDGKGKENKIEKEIMVKLSWTAEKELELNMQISKFVPYTINEKKGLVLQTIVKSYLKNNTLPVKENKIEISVPSINNIKPEQVKVAANTTKATNGDEVGANFNSENYSYNAEINKLTIQVKNTADQNKNISWEKQAQDEFIVTYVYPQEVLETLNNEEAAKVTIQANSEIIVQEANETKLQKEFSGEVTLKDQISDLVDFTIITETKELSKGQIYANTIASKKIETEYKETLVANIALTELTDKIVLEQKADNFVTAGNEKVSMEKDSYYKTISISKENFDKILGQEGTSDIYVGTILVTKIDKETKENDNGKIEVSLTELNANEIKIETSKPIAEGKIIFELTKAIKGEIDYTKAELKEFSKLELNLTGKAVNAETDFANQTTAGEIAFVEPTSQAELTISNSNLSTVVTNEDVKITAILKTDTLNCNLYQNPTLKINMPSYIENINIKNVEVLFDTEGAKLTLKGYQVVENADGTKTILVNLEGTQTEYTLGAVSKGLNVVITSDIIVNKLTPNKQEQITMTYTNSNVITKARSVVEENEVSTQVNFVAPTGVITTTSISNYADGSETITSISGEEKVATIATMTDKRDVTFTMNVINNYNNTIDNISILGRTPFKGNKDIVNGEDLSSTMNMPLTSAISVTNVDASKVKVYYSENGEATKDLNNTANAWTLTPASLENVKSYLIVITDHSMNTGEDILFTYNAQIPASLQHNEEAYETYVAYFNNNLETGKVEDKEVATKLGVTTGTGPVLETTLTSNVDEETPVQTGRFIKYNVIVKNTGKQIAENVVTTIDIPNCTNYIEFYNGETGYYSEDYEKTQVTYELGNLNPDQSIEKSFWVVVEKLEAEDICQDETHFTEVEGQKYHKSDIEHSDEEYKAIITTKATASAKDMANPVQSNELKNNVKKAYFKIDAHTKTDSLELLSEGQETEYTVLVQAYDSNKQLTNTIVTIPVPEGLTYKEARIEQYNLEKDEVETSADGISYDKNSNSVIVSLGTIESNNNKKIIVTYIVDSLKTDEYIKEVTSIAKVKADGVEEETSQEVKDKIAKERITIKQTSSVPSNVSIEAGEKFSYIITIENIGEKQVSNLNVKDYLPEELQHISTSYMIGEFKKEIYALDEDNLVSLDLNIPKGEKIEITINVLAKELTEQKEITNIVKVSSDTIAEIETNKISHTIEAANYEEDKTEANITKKIAGMIWKDANNDGIKDEDEEKVSNVEVLLFNNVTGDLVRDAEGNILKITTEQDGSYTFEEIPQGRYTVIFLYDIANYSATVYHKAEVGEEKNSDAVDTDIVLDGKTRTAAITEEITITNSNIYNIDLGIIENKKFDLSLDKIVSKITVQDSNGTNVYDYENTKLAKKDLVGKEINNTTIIVEYKMIVTNEGAVPGYVKKIVDYLPSEMKFSSELNRDWYVAENGAIYNSSLANTLINPGESKTVTLLLTKKMTEENLGLYHNTAEIYEAYNDLGIEDVDSIEGNKVSNEDDISTADVLITVKTGEAILFVGLTITIILSIGIGAFFIKKKVLR